MKKCCLNCLRGKSEQGQSKAGNIVILYTDAVKKCVLITLAFTVRQIIRISKALHYVKMHFIRNILTRGQIVLD